MKRHSFWRAGESADAEPRLGADRAAAARVPHFLGEVAIVPRVREEGGASILDVVFAAGARTEWHRHECGQLLESVAGVGWVEELGGETRTLSPGDRAWCPPGATHRHGAGAEGPWTQSSVTLGETIWLEDPASAGAGAATNETDRTEDRG